MKASQVLMIAMAAGAIAAPFDPGRETACAQPRTSVAHRGHVPVSRRRNRVAQFATIDAGRSAREGRSPRRLDLYLHQLAAHPPLRARMGRQIQGSRARGDRRAFARVPVRARRRQRASGGHRDAGCVSRRDRQRLRDLERTQQPVLARALSRRCARAHSPSPIRRGWLRPDRTDHSATAARGGKQRLRPRSRHGRCARPRGSRRLERLEVA